MSKETEELVRAQNQVIGILFEIVKRQQANINLDEEYFGIVAKQSVTKQDKSRLDEILRERVKNAELVGRLLKQLEA